MKKQTIISAVVIIVFVVLVVYLIRNHRSNEIVPTETATSQNQVQASSTTNQTSKTMQPIETTTASGLKITVLKEGTGVGAANGDMVGVNYTGMFTNGTAFDSNVDPKFQHVQPFSFQLGAGMVIKGWDEGVLGMKVGEKRHLVIPANLGYGASGAGGVIPPNATLEFDVEVTSITHK